MSNPETAAQAASMQYQLAHLKDNRSGPLKAVLIAGLALSTVAVILRIWSRRLVKAPCRSDDWTIIGSLVLTYGLCICKFLEISMFGLGTHVAAAGPDKVTGFLKCLYAFTILYMINYPLIKISILLLYHRIFTLGAYRLMIKFCIVYMLLFQMSFILVSIFICTPIHSFWDLSKPSKCIDSVDFYVANSALNIFTDLVILILPMPIVWKLHVSRKQKTVLSLVFVLGSIVLIASIFRVITYLEIDNNDPLWTFIPCAIWTMIEIPLAIICACLPTMRPLFRGMVGGIFSKLSSSDRSSPASSKTRPFQPLRNNPSAERPVTDDTKIQSREMTSMTTTEQLNSTGPMKTEASVPMAYANDQATAWEVVPDLEETLPPPTKSSNARY